MARLARVVVPGVPHLVVQRGNRNQETFLREKDYAAYIDLMAEWCGRLKVKVWAYSLMPNHTNLLCIPKTEDGRRFRHPREGRKFGNHSTDLANLANNGVGTDRKCLGIGRDFI